MYKKWKPSKKAAADFSEKMTEIDQFCKENGISQSRTGDSYYFLLNGKQYRVSNHTIAASNTRAYNWAGDQIREKYHADEDDLICITAGKTRIIDIYNDLKNGYILDKRGYRK